MKRNQIDQYIFNGETCLKGKKALELINNNSFQWVFKDGEAVLIIEKEGRGLIHATIKNVSKNTGTIKEWDETDYGQAVFNEDKGDYELVYGKPRMFRVFKNNWEGEPWSFNFHFYHHLILKDKDQRKPWYWYYFDYSPSLAQFIYKKLSKNIKKDQGEIVAIPGELGEGVKPWEENGYIVNYFYCGFDEENNNYDFYTETTEKWIKNNGKTALVVSFLPTYFRNYELDKGEKTTGTTWTKQLFKVFKGVPMVIKAYRGFIYTQLFRNYKEIYDQISSIVELPTEIDQRETGTGNLLVFFNCPFLSEKIKYIN